MVSQLAWLDHDEQQRKRVMQVIDQFRDEGTVDELGLGSIRDTFAQLLFPGTSTLHTRARYMLFIPWLIQDTIASSADTAGEPSLLDRKERQLILALLNGGETQGVIGGTAKDKLKRLPSGMFWSATATYGLRTRGGSINATLRDARSARRSNRRMVSADDPGAHQHLVSDGFDPRLPLAPPGLLGATTFAMPANEAEYLRGRIIDTQPKSLFPWLFEQGIDEDARFVWEHRDIGTLTGPLKGIVDHGRRFSITAAGATILYNLLVAQAKHADEHIEFYSEEWDAWQHEMRDENVLGGWDREEFWKLMRQHNSRIALPTIDFVTRWIEQAAQSPDGPPSDAARSLIRDREIQLKSHRARLGDNRAAVDSWLGASGGQLTYNWPVAVRILRDIIEGCES
ncbi:DUF6361 family protein [Tomitella biformata]|uniref:DUF6361 family protein n=1 Tax=Tomitella biformata TaxID=630403 RepID=UPI000467C450|nr:DUF6361 family protein [Tomitella biformata]